MTGRIGKLALPLLLLAACAGGGGPSAPEPGWTADFDAALAQAGRENKPLLVYFTGKAW